MRLALAVIGALLTSHTAFAQTCENPIVDLAQCKSRRPLDPPYVATVSVPPCGPEGFPIKAPQGYGIADFIPGCSAHDICYETCNSDKTTCDEEFRKTITLECAQKYPFPALGSREDDLDWAHRGE